MNYSKNIFTCRYLLQVVAVYCCIVSMDQLLLTAIILLSVVCVTLYLTSNVETLCTKTGYCHVCNRPVYVVLIQAAQVHFMNVHYFVHSVSMWVLEVRYSYSLCMMFVCACVCECLCVCVCMCVKL